MRVVGLFEQFQRYDDRYIFHSFVAGQSVFDNFRSLLHSSSRYTTHTQRDLVQFNDFAIEGSTAPRRNRIADGRCCRVLIGM